MGTCESIEVPNLEDFDPSKINFDIPVKKEISKYITNKKPIYFQTTTCTSLRGEFTGTKIPIVIKKFPKTEKGKINFTAEIFNYKNLDHPNLSNLLDYFQTVDHYYIILEFFDGINLVDYFIQNKNVMNEKNICKCITDILMAVNHMHSKGICHRNLDPKKIIYNGKSILLIGINYSRKFDKKNILKFKNSPLKTFYKAPEVLSKSYNEKSDIWTLGIIFLALITGKNSFEKKQQKKQLKQL